MDKKYIVYKHTNKINGKVYIGITSKKPEYRWNKGKNYIDNEHFYRAINKYGWDNFEHVILFENLTKEEAENKEIQLISEYDSTNENKGYNNSIGGGLSLIRLRKKVNCYNLDGVFLNTFESITEAEEKLNLGNSHIAECCNGKFKKTGNYTFRFVSEEFPVGKNIEFKYKQNIRIINFYDLDGKYLFSINGLKNASRQTKIHVFNISSCCEGKHNIAGKYITRYLTEEFPKGKNLNLTKNKKKI